MGYLFALDQPDTLHVTHALFALCVNCHYEGGGGGCINAYIRAFIHACSPNLEVNTPLFSSEFISRRGPTIRKGMFFLCVFGSNHCVSAVAQAGHVNHVKVDTKWCLLTE